MRAPTDTPEGPTAQRRLSALSPFLLPPVLGAIAACGFQPLALWPLTLLGVGGLAWLGGRARSPLSAGLAGWLWGVGHFSLGNNWIATAFTYQAQMPAWLGGIAVFLLSLFLAIYPAMALVAARWIVGPDAARAKAGTFVLALAGCWIISEWLRSWIFTGFPWNPLGAAAVGPFNRAGLAQLLPWLGTYALSGMMVLLGGAWWLAATAWRRNRQVNLTVLMLVLIPILALIVPQLTPIDRPGTVSFTLVQPGVRQQDIDDPALFTAQFQTTARLSLPRYPGQRRLVLWPESGVPDYLRDGYPEWAYGDNTYGGDPGLARSRIARTIGDGSLLLTGAVDLVVQDSKVVAAHNVVTAVDATGAIRAGYDKAHLVPYGEYLPMRGVLTPLGLSRLVAGNLDFWPGPGPRTLDLAPWGKAGIQICYEIVFSGEVVDPLHRPDYIFNPSNDGWFGDWGPPQHLAQARMRAIEEGVPVLRATTNGISAIVDANGIVRQSLPRPAGARLDGLVPPVHEPTLFARMGNALPLCWAAVLLVGAMLVRRRWRG